MADDNSGKKESRTLPVDSLRRNVAAGMDPDFLQTSYYGPDNKRIKHRVHRGALHLPADVLDKYEPPDKEYELPAIGSVTRPSLDDSRKIVVAQVRYEERLEDVVVDGLPQKRPVSRILITNEFLKEPDAQRIRGGGDEPVGQPGSSAATPMEIDQTPTNAPAPTVPTQSNTNTASSMTTSAPTAAAAPQVAIVQPPPIATGQTPAVGISLQSSNSNTTTTASQPLATQSSGNAAAVPAESALGSAGSTNPALAQTKISSTTSSAKQPPEVPSSDATSNTGPKSEGPKVKDPKVVPLAETPMSQWEQRKPRTDEVPLETVSSSKPDWYQPDSASELEKAILPEWFDETAKHRTPESFIQVREKMIRMASNLGKNRFLTGTMVRRSIPGDAASLLRLHDFLSSYGLINENAINDTQPALKVLYKNSTATTRDNIVKAVVQQVRSKKRSDDSGSNTSMDNLEVNWDEVAAVVGEGMTAASCERTFMEMTTGSGPGEVRLVEDSSVADLLAKCDPAVVQAAVTAALAKSNDWNEARDAASVASVVAHANREAETHESRLAQILGQTLDTRMNRLENRLAMLEEVEGMLDAERMALDLERRDLYTARCRHWFNGT